jgi:hypothetical protein
MRELKIVSLQVFCCMRQHGFDLNPKSRLYKKIRATLDGWLGPDSHDKVLAMQLPVSCQLIFESTFGCSSAVQHDSVEDFKG